MELCALNPTGRKALLVSGYAIRHLYRSEKIIKFTNTEIPLFLHSARVIHANKYSEAYGGAFNLPVSSTLHTDVVFRLNETREDYKTYIKNLDLPIYNAQEVTISMPAAKRVPCYIEMHTNNHYYTTKDFSRLLGIGLLYILGLPNRYFWVEFAVTSLMIGKSLYGFLFHFLVA